MLLRELRARGYTGGYTILKDWLHPQRQSAHAVAVRRFEEKHATFEEILIQVSKEAAP